MRRFLLFEPPILFVAEEMPAINAVVGGIVANEVLKATSGKGEPIRNFFLFSLTDGAGFVQFFG
jgi:ubiquitin-like 1-activating enzyme E1 A